MLWIAKTLLKILNHVGNEVDLTIMPVVPLWAGLPALIVAKIKRKKAILRLEAQKIECQRLDDVANSVPRLIIEVRSLVLRTIYFLTIPFYDAVIGISNEVAREARRYGAKRVFCIAIPIDLNRFRPATEEKNNKEVVLLSVGQLRKRKGFDEIMEALRQLENEVGVSLRLLIAGDINSPEQQFFEELKKNAQELHIDFLGMVLHARMPDVYSKADIFITASHLESLGMATMEAMACGLPVIATKTGGSKDLIKDKVNGFLVEIADSKEMAEKIKILSSDKDLRRSMGLKSREIIEEMIGDIDINNKKFWRESLRENGD